MMEDNDEEENDDNYPVYPKTTDTAMEDNEDEKVKNGHQMCPLMILVRSLLMHR
jgi:hypothetical protein